MVPGRGGGARRGGGCSGGCTGMARPGRGERQVQGQGTAQLSWNWGPCTGTDKKMQQDARIAGNYLSVKPQPMEKRGRHLPAGTTTGTAHTAFKINQCMNYTRQTAATGPSTPSILHLGKPGQAARPPRPRLSLHPESWCLTCAHVVPARPAAPVSMYSIKFYSTTVFHRMRRLPASCVASHAR